jgi:hypothetical protein
MEKPTTRGQDMAGRFQQIVAGLASPCAPPRLLLRKVPVQSSQDVPPCLKAPPHEPRRWGFFLFAMVHSRRNTVNM